jgi:hypothetical protein
MARGKPESRFYLFPLRMLVQIIFLTLKAVVFHFFLGRLIVLQR